MLPRMIGLAAVLALTACEASQRWLDLYRLERLAAATEAKLDSMSLPMVRDELASDLPEVGLGVDLIAEGDTVTVSIARALARCVRASRDAGVPWRDTLAAVVEDVEQTWRLPSAWLPSWDEWEGHPINGALRRTRQVLSSCDSKHTRGLVYAGPTLDGNRTYLLHAMALVATGAWGESEVVLRGRAGGRRGIEVDTMSVPCSPEASFHARVVGGHAGQRGARADVECISVAVNIAAGQLHVAGLGRPKLPPAMHNGHATCDHGPRWCLWHEDAASVPGSWTFPRDRSEWAALDRTLEAAFGADSPLACRGNVVVIGSDATHDDVASALQALHLRGRRYRRHHGQDRPVRSPSGVIHLPTLPSGEVDLSAMETRLGISATALLPARAWSSRGAQTEE